MTIPRVCLYIFIKALFFFLFLFGYYYYILCNHCNVTIKNAIQLLQSTLFIQYQFELFKHEQSPIDSDERVSRRWLQWAKAKYICLYGWCLVIYSMIDDDDDNSSDCHFPCWAIVCSSTSDNTTFYDDDVIVQYHLITSSVQLVVFVIVVLIDGLVIFGYDQFTDATNHFERYVNHNHNQ